jgi:hypothetical protein
MAAATCSDVVFCCGGSFSTITTALFRSKCLLFVLLVPSMTPQERIDLLDVLKPSKILLMQPMLKISHLTRHTFEQAFGGSHDDLKPSALCQLKGLIVTT